MNDVPQDAPLRALVRAPLHLIGRANSWLREHPAGLAVLAVAIGLGAGLGAVAFRYMITWITLALTGHADYSSAGHAPNPFVPALGIWFVVLAPVAGGLLYGPLVDRFAREARGHGVPEVMLAVARAGGRIRPRVAVVKSLASALCIGSGGSVGREGPIVQIGSALGSTLGQALRFPESRLRLLVACGAAGGISATFNTPIAGVFFALELILRDFEAESFGVVVLASIAANVVGRAAFGSQPFLQLPAFQLASVLEYPLYLGLGVLAAIAGVGFIKVLYGLEDLADRVWRGPEWLRPAVGGVLLGLLLLALPQMYGVGYPVLEAGIREQFTLGFLLVLLAAKVLGTSLTIAIGGSGGVFAPSLFQGAMLGTAYGVVVNRLFPAIAAPAGAYGLVGMGAVFAAAARAPITAAIIIFELTGEYRIMLPLLFAIAVAAGLSHLLSRDTIYTLKLRRRGIELAGEARRDPLAGLRVRDVMQRPPDPLPETATLEEVVARFASGDEDALPVVDGAGRLLGVLSRDQVERVMRDESPETVVGPLARRSLTVCEDAGLEEALALLVKERTGVPVLASRGDAMVGWLSHREVLGAYLRRTGGGARPPGG